MTGETDILTMQLPKPQRGEPTWGMALTYPLQGDWTEEEYLRLDIGWLVEFDNGCVELLPMPTVAHQFMLQYLFRLLDAFVEQQQLGRVLLAPCPIRVAKKKYREPDLFMLRWSRIPHATQSPNGADFVLEMVSPGERNRQRDFDEKAKDYAQVGIPEYWIVDPEQELIRVLVLEGPAYRLHGEFRAGERASSVALPGFEVEVAAVWQAGKMPEGEANVENSP